MSDVVYYQSNGIKVNRIDDVSTSFYIQENIGEKLFESRYWYSGDTINQDIDVACVCLYDVFTRRIFLNEEEYYKYIEYVPVSFMKAGLESDCSISKEEFQLLLDKELNYGCDIDQENNECEKKYDFFKKYKNKYLYLYDCGALINSLQELLNICSSNFVFFYKTFCEIEGEADFGEDYYSMSAQGRVVISIATNLFISLYSMFDILMKISYELEHIKLCEESYSKLSSSKKLYGDKKDLKKLDFTGTIFEKSRTISMIENLRNDLIHNSVWEMNSKIYFRVKDGNIVGKAMYYPDFSDEGYLISYKNRKRFFSMGIQLNEVLPQIYFDALKRIKITVERLIKE